jgi:hypothetical protein
MFRVMELARRTMGVEAYNVRQTSLEQVFLAFSGKQKPLPEPTETGGGTLKNASNFQRLFWFVAFLSLDGENHQNFIFKKTEMTTRRYRWKLR